MQMKCPMCDEMLTYDITATDDGRINGEAQYSIRGKTNPESTAHIWTHAPEGGSHDR